MSRIALGIETAFALMLAWTLVFVVPFRWTARRFGQIEPPADTCDRRDEAALVLGVAVAARVRWVATRLPWSSSCLVRAVAGLMLLRRRGVRGARIRFGVAKGADGLKAHAWLILGEAMLLGGEVAADYAAVAELGAAARERG